MNNKNNKVITADEAIALISENDVLTTTGFVQSCIPEALHAALEKRFVETSGSARPHPDHDRRRRRQQRPRHRSSAS